jgi:GR25 family glycosyltransferase involved in LPS biosynthesis
MNVDHIFIVHYTPLSDRKAYLIKKFNEFGITNYTFYEEYNRNTTSKETMKQYFTLDNLTPAQICITIAHLELYRLIVQRKYTKCLILEDDAILCPDFDVKLASYLNSLPSDFDLAFICGGCGLRSQNITPNTVWYREFSSRTCSGYLINVTACERLLKTAIPFVKAIDHELNIQINEHNLVTYWAEPVLIEHGSETVYKSSYVYY